MFFFPLRDGEFYYYRNGRLIANESYWRDQEQSRFEPEVELYRRFRVDNQREMVRCSFTMVTKSPSSAARATMHRIRIGRSLLSDLANGIKRLHR